MIPVYEPSLIGNELKYVKECLETNWISSLGKYINKFEKEFSKYCNTKYGVACSSGTTALHLALESLGIKQGDEVIIPNLTFIATPNSVSYTGAKPVLVDSEMETWNIDTNKIKEKITKRTKAIIPVHLYGHPCDMNPIMELAEKYNLYVIEDAAEAHGAEYKGKKIGSIGHINCFSFYGNKIITTGEGGICTTNDEKLAERMHFLKDHGMSKEKRYWHNEIAFNYRMTNIQAAIGCAQLENIDKFIEIKRKNAKIYNKFLKDTANITLPIEKKWAKNIYWMYSILVKDKEKIIKKLKENNIDSRPFFHPIHTMPPYKTNDQFPTSEKISRDGINLPSSVKLTEKQIKYICKIIDLFTKNKLKV